MNMRSTLNVSTPKSSNKKQNSFKDLVIASSSKKDINVFVPRVAFLDIASNRKMKQDNLFKNIDSVMGMETSYGNQKKTRPLMHMSRVAMFEDEPQGTVEPVSSLLLGMMPEKILKYGRRNTGWIR